MSGSRRLLSAAGAAALLLAGAGLGSGLYAALAPARTTTVVRDVAAPGQQSTAAAASPVAATSPSQAGGSVESIYTHAHEGVVDITVVDPASRSGGNPFNGSPLTPGGGSGSTQAEGSGFVIDARGDIVTNDHVVAGASRITVTLWNGKAFSGKVVGADGSTDLAVVRISAPASLLQPLSFGDSDAVHVGDPVVAIGSPFGLAQTVTTGIVSALHRTIDSPNNFSISDSIQTDAPINHGNSGGPLLDGAGQVTGVNAQIQSQSGGSEGIAFSIPSNTVRSVVDQLVAGKTVAHAYLGVRVQDSASPLGADLAQIIPGTPAAKAGLRDGDVVTRLDGTAITSESGLSAVIDGKKPGDTMTVTYVRRGKTATVTVTLVSRPS
jgi:putative serine protease PepD